MADLVDRAAIDLNGLQRQILAVEEHGRTFGGVGGGDDGETRRHNRLRIVDAKVH